MSSSFIRGLWGDQQIPKWITALADIALTLGQRAHPEPIVTYVYGRDNQRYLNHVRVRHEALSEDAVCNWNRAAKREPNRHRRENRRGQVNFGVSMWRHKLVMIRHALATFSEVVWLDWDCRMRGKLPPDFWARCREGRPIQAGMRSLKFPTAMWREYGQTEVPHGAFIYCRDAKIIEDLLALSEEHPEWLDENLMALWIERQWGGWGPDSVHRWKRDGYEPWCYDHRKLTFPNSEAIFRE